MPTKKRSPPKRNGTSSKSARAPNENSVRRRSDFEKKKQKKSKNKQRSMNEMRNKRGGSNNNNTNRKGKTSARDQIRNRGDRDKSDKGKFNRFTDPNYSSFIDTYSLLFSIVFFFCITSR